MNKKKETIKTYNQSAPALAKYFDSIGSRIKDIERGFSYIHKKNPKVLEIGCGNGRDARDILNFTNDYVGIDISEGMVKLAKESIPDTNFLVSDVEEFDFPLNTDIIFAFASLLHLDKSAVREVLIKAHKSLTVNGIFYISVKRDNYQEKMKVDEFGQRVFYYYKESDLRNLAQETGYEVIYEDTQLMKNTEWLTVIFKKV